MKKPFFCIVIIGAMLFSASTLCEAGNSVSIAVSCTVPVIPGVNNDVIVEEKTIALPQISREELIMEEHMQQSIARDAQVQGYLIRTIYSR